MQFTTLLAAAALALGVAADTKCYFCHDSPYNGMGKGRTSNLCCSLPFRRGCLGAPNNTSSAPGLVEL